MKDKICKNCDAPLLLRSQTTFCNHKCQKDYEYKTYIAQWRLGNVSGLRGKYGISRHIRRFLFEKFNSKCSRCGWSAVSEFTGNIPLEIEHLDGDFNNSIEDNLTLLCPNCHSLTSTYRSLNIGNGRKARSIYNLP